MSLIDCAYPYENLLAQHCLLAELAWKCQAMLCPTQGISEVAVVVIHITANNFILNVHGTINCHAACDRPAVRKDLNLDQLPQPPLHPQGWV